MLEEDLSEESNMKQLFILLVFLIAGAVHAEPARILRCFSRAYTPEHMSRNPMQIVHHIKLALATDSSGRPLYGFIRAFAPDRFNSWIRLTGGGHCLRNYSHGTHTYLSCSVFPNSGKYVLDVNPQGVLLTVTQNVLLDMQPGDPGDRAILNEGETNGLYYLYNVPIKECDDFDI